MARKRKATKAEIIKRILDEDAQREEELRFFYISGLSREGARKALNRDTREELLAEWFEGTWDGYFWVQPARKNPRNSTGYVRAKIRANSARRNGDSSQGLTKKEMIDSIVAYTTQAWEYEGERFHPADEAEMRQELNKLTNKELAVVLTEREETW